MGRFIICRYLTNEFSKILQNTSPIPQLSLWREVKLGSYKLQDGGMDDLTPDDPHYYRRFLACNSSLPPTAIVSLQRIASDERFLQIPAVTRRDVPLHKERVPYLVVYGAPGVQKGGANER